MADGDVRRCHAQGGRVELRLWRRGDAFEVDFALALVDVQAQGHFAALPGAQLLFPANALQGEITDGVAVQAGLVKG
ncbi:hypothetical protein D3C81_2057620 [compost metagenome]